MPHIELAKVLEDTMAIGLITCGFFGRQITTLRYCINVLNGCVENFWDLRNSGILLLTPVTLIAPSKTQDTRCNSLLVTTCEYQGVQTCKVTTQAKLTLKNLQYGACLTKR